jgi:hypothetical protein
MRREVFDVRDGRVKFTLDNRTGWASRDLARLFARGLKAYGIFTHVDIIAWPSPIRSRGCAQIGRGGRNGRAMVIAMASPSHFDLRRLARLFEHEVSHTKGQQHEDMSHDVLWSLGPVPAWAKVSLRWRGSRASLSRKPGRRTRH